jgi:transposase
MDTLKLFTLALGLEKPWIITKVNLDSASSQLGIYIDFERGFKFKMADGGSYSAYDSSERRWQHLKGLCLADLGYF